MIHTQSPRAIRKQRAADPHRPRYHFLPPENWMNDPNGIIHWKGQYHLFYQYNPYAPVWGNIHWGHAISSDLVHWADLPIALAPTPGTADEDGCWSGCAVDDDGTPSLIYTGSRGGQQRPCLAISDDDLITWQKYADNPIIPAPPPDLDLLGFRDHCLWREGTTWYQIIGAGIRDVGGTALLYRSDDLITWDYLHPLCMGNADETEPLWTGTLWECPQLIDMGDTHLLIISVWKEERTYYSACFIGTYENHRFTPREVFRLDYGDNYFYAPQAMKDQSGRWLMWGWLQEGRSIEEQQEAGWSGVMSLPRQLSLDAAGRLHIAPVPELKTLRGRAYERSELDVAPLSTHHLPDIQGDSLEIIAVLAPGEAQSCGIAVRCSSDNEEQTIIGYNRQDATLFLDSTSGSLSTDAVGDVRSGNLTLAEGEPLRLHIFLDGSVIEVFANERACVSGRVYPDEESLGVDLVARGGKAHLLSLQVWELKTIY